MWQKLATVTQRIEARDYIDIAALLRSGLNHDDSARGHSRTPHDDMLVRSVYFTDPNGIMLELAATTRAFGLEDVSLEPARARPARAT